MKGEPRDDKARQNHFYQFTSRDVTVGGATGSKTVRLTGTAVVREIDDISYMRVDGGTSSPGCFTLKQ